MNSMQMHARQMFITHLSEILTVILVVVITIGFYHGYASAKVDFPDMRITDVSLVQKQCIFYECTVTVSNRSDKRQTVQLFCGKLGHGFFSKEITLQPGKAKKVKGSIRRRADFNQLKVTLSTDKYGTFFKKLVDIAPITMGILDFDLNYNEKDKKFYWHARIKNTSTFEVCKIHIHAGIWVNGVYKTTGGGQTLDIEPGEIVTLNRSVLFQNKPLTCKLSVREISSNYYFATKKIRYVPGKASKRLRTKKIR